jgi:ABC-2 type transport system ATP-binding protein
MINLLTGNLRPSLGTVRVQGVDPWRHRSVLRSIGLCPASDLYLPSVSAIDWVTYMLGLGGFSRSEARQRAVTSLRKVGMEANQHRPIGNYSLGMRQRTKLAQAIAHDPQWLILDEPFNGLDPVGRHELADLVREWSQQGRGLLLASHVLHEVESVTSQFLLIFGGRLLASGNASEVQSMLVDFPKEVRLLGKGLQPLASSLIQCAAVNFVRLSPDGREMTIGARNATAFYELLRQKVVELKVEVEQIVSPDGNLAMAFDTLMRVHRGELE